MRHHRNLNNRNFVWRREAVGETTHWEGGVAHPIPTRPPSAPPLHGVCVCMALPSRARRWLGLPRLMAETARTGRCIGQFTCPSVHAYTPASPFSFTVDRLTSSRAGLQQQQQPGHSFSTPVHTHYTWGLVHGAWPPLKSRQYGGRPRPSVRSLNGTAAAAAAFSYRPTRTRWPDHTIQPCTHTHTHTHTERERERERRVQLNLFPESERKMGILTLPVVSRYKSMKYSRLSASLYLIAKYYYGLLNAIRFGRMNFFSVLRSRFP